ncbi:MAG: DNA adenine methylase [Candidatus Marinimicrobia bacterium]|nr:DNA adenine methylase [Candidatus Neomarinimicrobiota bacterium]
MGVTLSPLRYPGGKAILGNFLGSTISANKLEGAIYVEPYAGGAGAALKLLFGGQVAKVILNDKSEFIYQIWRGILLEPEGFLKLLSDTPVTIKEWHKQQRIYTKPDKFSPLEVGFATFFLNRTNHSGILYARPIGGLQQNGKWKLDARYKKDKLKAKIEKIAARADDIEFHNKDALVFLAEDILPLAKQGKALFVYYDPPYYENGKKLYLNHYNDDNHRELAEFIKAQTSFKWVLSYDNHPEILNLYKDMQVDELNLYHFAYKAHLGKELLITNGHCVLPKEALARFQLAT